MPLLAGTGDSPTAIDSALAQLRDAAAAGGGASKGPASPYRIPVRTGRRENVMVNLGARGDDSAGPGRTLTGRIPGGSKDQVDHFDLTDDGVQAAIGAWYSFDDGERDNLMKRMWFLGLIKDPHDFDAGYKTWQAAVGHAARFASTGREIDPRDVLEMLADGNAGAGAEKQGPVTRRSIDLTDPATAREWVQQAFKQSMGRKAEDAEVRALVEALHEKQRNNPQVQTETPTKWDADGRAIDSTTTTTGGVDPDAFFAQRMASDPEAGAHQAAAEYWPALLQALGAGI